MNIVVWISISIVYLAIALLAAALLRKTKTFERPLCLIVASAISPIILFLAVALVAIAAIIILIVTTIGRIVTTIGCIVHNVYQLFKPKEENEEV